ncbi:MAG: TolC family protein [Candidatus Omnitrophica bacterium]|nr:TolC family protein [Candidatus Omnitrophota bacterium]
MKKMIRLFIGTGMAVSIFFLLFSESFAENIKSSKLTLGECYRLALKQSETIAINSEVIREAEARFTQALGTILPQVSFVWTQTNQDSERAFSSYNHNGSFESKFVFKQTLFSGFKEFAGMAGSRLEQKQRINEKKRAEELLFVDVADAFYLLLEEQEDLKTMALIRKALNDRIVELKKREDVGRSRHSEIVNAETQLYNIEAEIQLVKSQELVAKELLAFLIGRDPGALLDKEDTPDSLEPESFYAVNFGSRSDVKAFDFATGVAKKEAYIAKTALLPTVTVQGDYYERRNTTPLDVSWDTVLKISVPIFEGTTTYGNIAQANAKSREAKLQYNRAKRLAIQDIHDSYVKAYSAILRSNAMEKALKSAELNYSLQKEDYRNNLVSNLDVLTAIQNFGNTRRSYMNAFYEKKRAYWQLQAATGNIIEDEIK